MARERERETERGREREPERTARTVAAVSGRERDGIILERETAAVVTRLTYTQARAVALTHTRTTPTRARARTQTNGGGGGGNGARTLCVRRRAEWRCDERRASGKMSAHWSARNMTWKIINMVRGGDYGQRSAAAVARQCCRFAVQNINGSCARAIIFIPNIPMMMMTTTMMISIVYCFFSKSLSFRFLRYT